MTVSHFLSTRSASGVDKSKLMHLIKHLIYIHKHTQTLQRKAKANSTKNGLIKCWKCTLICTTLSFEKLKSEFKCIETRAQVGSGAAQRSHAMGVRPPLSAPPSGATETRPIIITIWMGLNQQFNLHLFYLDIFILNQELETILYCIFKEWETSDINSHIWYNIIFCFKGIILNQELLAI